jgi:hypothetical protein
MGLMQRLLVLSVLPCLLAGCAGLAGNGGEETAAQRCAEDWKAQGFDFDPNIMTCEQMYTRAQALRSAAYWRKRGYLFDPDSMTAEDMDREVFKLRQKGIGRYRDPSLAEGRPTAADTAREDAARPNSAPAGNPAAWGNGTSSEVAGETESGDRWRQRTVKKWLQDATIRQVRRRYPQYNDLDDLELAQRIHATYFADAPFGTFAQRFLGGAP